MTMDAHVISRPDGALCKWTGSSSSLFGYMGLERAGECVAEMLFPAVFQDEVRKRMRQALEQGRATWESLLIRQDGSAFWGVVECAATHENADPVLAWQVRDATAEKISKTARILERRHARFLEVLPEAVLVLDASAHVVYASRKAHDLMGSGGGLLVGRAANGLLLTDEKVEGHCLKLAGMKEVKPGEPLRVLEARLASATGATELKLSMRLFASDSEAGVLWLVMAEAQPQPQAQAQQAPATLPGAPLLQSLRREVLHQEQAPPEVTQSVRARPLVLLVDDEAAMRDILAMHLQEDFDVVSARNGAEAFEMALAHLPDMILSDIRMPVRNGLEFCRDLRGDERTQDIPLVVLTATDDQAMKLDCLAAGATDFLSKPCSGTELRLRARNLSRMHRQQQELTTKTRRLEQALHEVRKKDELLVRQERLAALGRMSAGLIHEINNPLNYSMQGLNLLRRAVDGLPGESRPEFIEVLNDIEEGVNRVARIIGDLRGFAASPIRAVHQPVGLASVVELALKHLSHAWAPVCEPQVDMSEDFCILGDRHQMVQVMVNLVKNALDAIAAKTYASQEAPALLLKAERVDGRVRLIIQDNGTGMEPEVAAHIFEPFYTTKEVGQGIGLGLSICHSILAEHGAKVDVKSVPGEFTRFILDFPAPAMSDL
jgi:PAS domain S-box-containing protein